MRRLRLLIEAALALVLVLAALAAAGMAVAGGSPDIGWNVLAGGGGQVAGGAYTLDNTFGQAIVNLAGGGSYELCSGFWCLGATSGERSNNPLYLPLLLRAG